MTADMVWRDVKKRFKAFLGKGRGAAIAPQMNQVEKASSVITDRMIIDRVTSDADNTFLVSFPRTGSHWLRMLMELYFERPSLVRIFYYPNRQDYLTLHSHDLDLKIERRNVIYLYRTPVDTIFSQLYYHKEPVSSRQRIEHWTELYGRHLDKWLCKEAFTGKKTIVTYEGMRQDLVAEFARVAGHFERPLDRRRLDAVAGKISKDEVKRKTGHDPQVVQLEESYVDIRSRFRAEHERFVWDVLTRGRPYLGDYFETETFERK